MTRGRKTRQISLTVAPFPVHCSLKAQGKKVLEEAAELYAEVDELQKNPDQLTCWLEDEAADLITATVNLLWLVGRKADREFTAEEVGRIANRALESCRDRNEKRGRYRERPNS